MLSLRLLILVVLPPMHRVDRARLYLQLLFPDAPFPIVLPLVAVPLPIDAPIPDVLVLPELQLQLRRAPAPKHVVSVLLQLWLVGNLSNW